MIRLRGRKGMIIQVDSGDLEGAPLASLGEVPIHHDVLWCVFLMNVLGPAGGPGRIKVVI